MTETAGNPSLWQRWKGLHLWAQILIGMGLGIALGTVLQATGNQDITVTFFKPVGDLFINLIKMLVVPLVFLSLICGVTSMSDPDKLGRIGLKAFGLYLITTAFAICIGLGLGTLIEPGAGLNYPVPETVGAAQDAPSIASILLNIVPGNPVQALAEGEILQIIFFAMMLGIATIMVGERAQPVVTFLNAASEVILRLTTMIMALAPYGVFALITWVAGSFGIDLLEGLVYLFFAVYLGAALHMALIYGGFVLFIARLSPVSFFAGTFDAIAVAYSSASSSATLPVTMRCAEENLGVSKGVSSFVLPMGATINMDGTALHLGVTSLFIAQAYGIDLTAADYGLIVLTATLASIGTAGVPGVSVLMMSMILGSIGLPQEGIALYVGIDRILDMARTAVNVTGDSMVNLLVAKSEREVDLATFRHEPEV